MNVRRMEMLMDRLESTDSYCQLNYSHECGSPSCIAGHAASLAIEHEGDWVDDLMKTELSYSNPYTDDVSNYTYEMLDRADLVHSVARLWLGIDSESAGNLFVADPFHLGGSRNPTANDAIKVLTHMVEAGEVDWGVTQ